MVCLACNLAGFEALPEPTQWAPSTIRRVCFQWAYRSGQRKPRTQKNKLVIWQPRFHIHALSFTSFQNVRPASGAARRDLSNGMLKVEFRLMFRELGLPESPNNINYGGVYIGHYGTLHCEAQAEHIKQSSIFKETDHMV